eukprot:CAMPEP_0196995464 /NCGR_PEP_ID=MMETSP1380-20130617/1562_1 /TAXON_ID=5936 /ORGANISM="Euplotes crassus, Strain CT5" /LENGTH=428 /DNA_ID=CAMNT_0042411131 /DNA_START=46 /DNA_END=1332 /DNA_ORIENTATION=+
MANNPGLVAVVRREIIDRVRDKYFVTAFQTFGHQEIPDVSAGDMKISQIKADLVNSDPADLITSFRGDINAVGVDLKETYMDVNVHWHYKSGILSFSGTARVRTNFHDLGMNIVMTKVDDGQFAIPQINVQDMNVNMDRGSFNLNLHCSGCPGFVEDIIRDILKGKLMDTVQNSIRDQVPQQANSIGNEILRNSYPRTFNLYDNIDLATALTSNILVKDDHLEVPLDATFFPKNQGYSRPSDAPEMPHYNPTDPGEMMMFFSSYLVDTLSTTIHSEIQTYDFTILGIQFQASLDPEAGDTDLYFEDGDFIVEAHPKIVSPFWQMGLHLGGSAKLSPSISSGDAQNMLSVTPTVKELKLDELKIVTPGDIYELDSISSYFNLFVQSFLNYFVIPVIPVPKLEVLPLTMKNSELDFHKAYSELGLLFEFS